MQNIIFSIYLGVLLGAIGLGIEQLNRFDKPTRIILLLLILTLLSESITFVLKLYGVTQTPVYHTYSVIEAGLISAYFFETIGISQKYLWIFAAFFFWTLAAVCNLIWFQPLEIFNSNILILESFTTIAMAIYVWYRMLLDDSLRNIVRYPAFWIWGCLLLYWSSTFSFWAFIRPLFNNGWRYRHIAIYIQGFVNIITYAGVGLAFLLYRKRSSANVT